MTAPGTARPPAHLQPDRPPDDSPLERLLRAPAAGPELQPPRLPSTTAEGADVAVSAEDTALGRLLLAVGPDDALLLSAYVADEAAEHRLLRRLAGAVSPRVVRAPSRTRPVAQQLQEYLAGERRAFDVPVDLAVATPFQRSVLTRLAAEVPYGERTTYGALARSLGRPSASRAVGAALGANPVCVVLPCHRVVAGTGALTGYAGGLEAKRALLDLEQGTR